MFFVCILIVFKLMRLIDREIVYISSLVVLSVFVVDYTRGKIRKIMCCLFNC